MDTEITKHTEPDTQPGCDINTANEEPVEGQNQVKDTVGHTENAQSGEARDEKPKKKKRAFKIFLLVFIALDIIIIALVLNGLWKYLDEYEYGTQTSAVERYIQLLKNKDYEAIFESSGFVTDDFNDKEQFIKYIERTLGECADQLLFTRAFSSPGEDIYALYVGREKKGEVRLVPAPETKEKWLTQAVVEKKYNSTYRITAPEHAQVYVNGHQLNDKYKEAEDAIAPGFELLNNKSLAPRVKQYIINTPMLNQPEITASCEGRSCTVDYDEKTKTTVVSVPLDEEQNYTALIKQTAEYFAGYISRGMTFQQLDQFLYKDSGYYNKIKRYDNEYFRDYDSAWIENMQVFNVAEWSPDAFSGEVTFIHVTKNGSRRKENPTHYRMLFINTDQGYKIVSVEIE